VRIRRRLGLAVAVAFFIGCAGRAGGPSSFVPPQPSLQAPFAREGNVNELPEPPIVHAVHGVARFSLIANLNPATGLPSFQYRGMHGIAPTIDINPGEAFEIDLTDELPPSTGMASLVNLHFHGLTVSPHKPGDDVLTMEAKPGETLHYVVHVPKNQESGLYWYHTHIHGEVSYQTGEGGMSGAIVIEGLTRHLPELAKMRQRLIIVRATGIGVNVRQSDDSDDMSGTSDAPGNDAMRPAFTNTHPCTFKDGLTVTLNGAYRPDITIAPGEKQFFRVVNATGHKTLRLNLEGETVEVVAIDGFALDSYPGTPPTLTERSVIMPPASRAEFVVTGPASGRARFRTLCYNTGPDGDADPYIVLAHVVAPKHASTGGDFSNRPLAVGSPLPQNVYTTALPPPAAKRLVILTENSKPKFFINGKAYSPSAPPMFVVRTGTVEEWRVLNDTYEIHDFHIHQIHFLIESVNGVKQTPLHWADSFIVPHRSAVGKDGVPGSVVLLMDFRDPIIRGEFVFHCHIADHEDEGMMAKIEAI